jgi:peptidyl-prolyl cis-trans isomerase D
LFACGKRHHPNGIAMFEFVRTHTKLLQFALVLLIFPSFVFFGIQGYSGFGDSANATVAKVDGKAITKSEWDQAHQRQVERLRRQLPNIDVKLFDNPATRRETLDTLVNERLLLAATHRQNLTVGDDRLKRIFLEDPQFAGLRNPDGSLNQAIVQAQGMSSEMFVEQLRQELGCSRCCAACRNRAWPRRPWPTPRSMRCCSAARWPSSASMRRLTR